MNHSLNLNMFHRLYFAFMAVLTLMCSCSSDRPDSLEPHLQTLQATDITRTEATISGVCQTIRVRRCRSYGFVTARTRVCLSVRMCLTTWTEV